jgi:hypothetical protein
MALDRQATSITILVVAIRLDGGCFIVGSLVHKKPPCLCQKGYITFDGYERNDFTDIN